MEMIKIVGRLTDFKGLPLEGGEVRFNDENFDSIYTATTDSDGRFDVMIEKRIYPSVFICQAYKESYLEYWHWNFNPSLNENLEVQIDGLELYGVKAWETKPTYPGLIVFFRPMSLKRYKALGNPDKNIPVLIAPDLEKSDLKITLDGREAHICGLNKVKEYISDTQYMDAYLAHVSLEDIQNFSRVTIMAFDRKTAERGMASFDVI